MDLLSPLIIDKNVTSIVRDLPKGIQLIASLVDGFSHSPIKSSHETGIPFMDVFEGDGEDNEMTGIRNKTSRSSKSMEGFELLARLHLHNPEMKSALEGLKAAAKAIPHIKGFVANFSNSLDLDEELDKIDLTGDPFEILGCKLQIFFN